MPFLLRIIRKNRWYPTEDTGFFSKESFPADPLADLNTSDKNKLSVWYIEDDKSNLERVATAYAASRNYPAPLEFAIFDLELPFNLEIDLTTTIGGTKDEYVNKSWHRDLVELTALRLVDLAVELANGAERERIPEKIILRWISKAVDSGQIEKSKLSPHITEKL